MAEHAWLESRMPLLGRRPLAGGAVNCSLAMSIRAGTRCGGIGGPPSRRRRCHLAVRHQMGGMPRPLDMRSAEGAASARHSLMRPQALPATSIGSLTVAPREDTGDDPGWPLVCRLASLSPPARRLKTRLTCSCQVNTDSSHEPDRGNQPSTAASMSLMALPSRSDSPRPAP